MSMAPKHTTNLQNEMQTAQGRVTTALGIDAPLTQLIARAVESGDIGQLQLAQSALIGQPDDVKRLIGSVWSRTMGGREPSRESLLQDASEKPVHYFLQVDGHALGGGMEDDVLLPDADGYALTGGGAYELRHGGIPVRVQILEGTTKQDAIILLEKAIGWLERDWTNLVGGYSPPHINTAIDEDDPFSDDD